MDQQEIFCANAELPKWVTTGRLAPSQLAPTSTASVLDCMLQIVSHSSFLHFMMTNYGGPLLMRFSAGPPTGTPGNVGAPQVAKKCWNG